MLNSVFLFYGENMYALRQELQRWKASFLEKYGQDALFHFSSQNWDLGVVKQALYAGGLFVSKKLIVIEGIPKDSADPQSIPTEKIDQFFTEFQEQVALLSPDTIVIFLSYKPDKRTKAFKRCSENVQMKAFDPYKEPQLKAFIAEQIAPFTLAPTEMDYLLLKVGNDCYRLAHEIEKLKF